MPEVAKRAVRISISVVGSGLITSWLVALCIDMLMFKDLVSDWSSARDLLGAALVLILFSSLYGLGVGIAALAFLLVPLLLFSAWAERSNFTSWKQLTLTGAGLGFVMGAGVLSLGNASLEGLVVAVISGIGGGIAGDLYFRQKRRFG